MLQLFDGISRIISKKDPWRGEHDNRMDGLITISELKYTIDEKSENPNDNIFVFHNPRIKVINISTFLTYIQFGSEEYYNYDLREPKRKIIHPDKIRETKKTVVSTNDWTNIPYYPTTLEKKENVVKYLISMGKQVPQSLLQEIANAKKQEIEQDAYNNIGNTSLNSDKSSDTNRSEHINNQQIYQSYSQNGHLSRIPTQMANPQQYYRQQPPPHKYSPEYAAYIGAKSRAQASARIRLGGAY
jgi:hypothetical protein